MVIPAFEYGVRNADRSSWASAVKVMSPASKGAPATTWVRIFAFCWTSMLSASKVRVPESPFEKAVSGS